MLRIVQTRRPDWVDQLATRPYGSPNLGDAVEHINVGIAVWDSENRFVGCNGYFRKMHAAVMEAMRPGTSYATFIELVAKEMLTDRDIGDRDDWIKQRVLEQHGSTAKHECPLGGRWFEVRKKALPAGGTVTHFLDITDRKVAEARLHDTLEDLKKSNAELERFASVASHDLREPLRKVQMFGERLAERHGADLSEDGLMCIERMNSAVLRMQILVDDLQALSRVASSSTPFEEVDLNRIARDVISDLEVRLSETEGVINVDDLPTIHANPTQMRQLFQNLINNAIKFAKQDVAPRIDIEASPHAPEISLPGAGNRTGWSITVTDNGIGFEEQDRDRIFEIFQRLHGRDAYDGAGLGLAICRRIVDRHGGSISATGRPGAGTTFTIILPATQDLESETDDAADQ